MQRRLMPWTTTGLLVLACSGGETPNDDNNGGAGKGATPMAGTSGSAGSSSGTTGKAGTGGSGGSVAGGGGSAGAMAPSGGTANAGTGAGPAGGTGPMGGAAGATATGGATGNAGATGAGAGGVSSGGRSGGPTGGVGSGGAPVGGMGGMGGAGGATGSTKAYTCNQVIGIDSTSEWYLGGFENQVPNDKWQIIYHHPGYVEDWADPNDEVWGLAPTSACTMNSTNPDRVIFNIYSETLTTKDALVTAIAKAITNFKAKYSRLQRIDILTMTRAPNNMPCVQGNNGSIVQQYVDDAAAAVVSAGPPPVIATQKFFALDCNVFDSGGPHFSTSGKPVVAKLYGDYYSAEP
jgi:hypothetical protein